MDIMQTGIVTLLKSAITGSGFPLPDDFDIDAAYPVIRAHNITALAYAGALNCGIDQKKPAMQQLFQSYLRAFQLSQQQMRALGRVFSAFNESGIDYLPLKGCIMKPFYPQPELRLMGDADVLIREEQYDRIVPVIEALGFTEAKGAEHHFTWKSDCLELELHKYLIKSDLMRCRDHFQNGWTHAEVSDGTRYAMDDVNTFAYLFTHFAEHYAFSGIGCRHVVDLWVYLRSHPQMDQDCLKAVLEKMDLWKFYQNIRKLIGVWFEEETPDERTEFISQAIFANGSWGSESNAALNKGVQDMGRKGSIALSRIKYIWDRLFPGAACLKGEYPILRRHPWLMPVMVCRRIAEKTILNRAILDKHMRQLSLLNRNELKARREMLEYVGLSADE